MRKGDGLTPQKNHQSSDRKEKTQAIIRHTENPIYGVQYFRRKIARNIGYRCYKYVYLNLGGTENERRTASEY